MLAHSTCQLKPQTPLFVPGLPHGSQSHHSPGHVWPGRHSCHLHYGAPHDFKHCRNPSHEGHRAAPHLPGPIFRLGTSEMETYSLIHCTGYPMSRKQVEQCPAHKHCPTAPVPKPSSGPAAAQVMAQNGGVTPPHCLPSAQSPRTKHQNKSHSVSTQRNQC